MRRACSLEKVEVAQVNLQLREVHAGQCNSIVCIDHDNRASVGIVCLTKYL
jgi:hypothetical protein